MRLAWVVLLVGCGFNSPVGKIGDQTGGASDAPVADFDYATCPLNYNLQLPGPSRYRLIPQGHAAWTQSDDCNDDLSGATHLVVLNTMTELMDVSAFVNSAADTAPGHSVWIGGVQPITALTPKDGWLGFDGAPLLDTWEPGEPNDGNTETDHSEQFVNLENAKRIADRPGNTNLGAVCECDGKPVASNAAAAILASRSK